MLYWILYSGDIVICKASCPKDSKDIENLLAVGYVEVSEQEYLSAIVENITPNVESSDYDEFVAGLMEGYQHG